jgi:hypothetical protein
MPSLLPQGLGLPMMSESFKVDTCGAAIISAPLATACGLLCAVVRGATCLPVSLLLTAACMIACPAISMGGWNLVCAQGQPVSMGMPLSQLVKACPDPETVALRRLITQCSGTYGASQGSVIMPLGPGDW